MARAIPRRWSRGRRRKTRCRRLGESDRRYRKRHHRRFHRARGRQQQRVERVVRGESAIPGPDLGLHDANVFRHGRCVGWVRCLARHAARRAVAVPRVSPDQRWPQGTTRAAQQTASTTEPTGFASRPYIRNRTLQDSPGDPWGTSFYDFYRFILRSAPDDAGDLSDVRQGRERSAAGQGYIRAGRFADAAAKIDLSGSLAAACPPWPAS